MADAVSIHGPARHDIMGGTTQCGDRHRDRSAVELVGRIIGNQTKLRQEFMSEERRERERDESTVDQLAPVGEIPAKVPRIPARPRPRPVDRSIHPSIGRLGFTAFCALSLFVRSE